MGSAWYYVLAAAIYRSLEPPYALAGLGIMYGYLRAFVVGHHRYENPEYRRYLRRFELAQLVLGKRRALLRENERIRRARVVVKATPTDLPNAHRVSS